MDELKKYIQNHKESLDLDEPGQVVWERIREEVKRVKEVKGVKRVGRIVLFSNWKIAVAACVVGLAGIGIWYVLSNTKTVMAPLIVKSESKKVIPESIQNNIEKTVKPETPIIAKIGQPKIKHSQKTEQNKAMGTADQITLLNLENSFTQVINLQKARISSMPMNAESADYFNDFKIQIKQMEVDEKVIKSDIAMHGVNDVLLDQLINLYQQKLNVLKQLQIEMTKTNNLYKQNRGPVDSIKTYFVNM